MSFSLHLKCLISLMPCIFRRLFKTLSRFKKKKKRDERARIFFFFPGKDKNRIIVKRP